MSAVKQNLKDQLQFAMSAIEYLLSQINEFDNMTDKERAELMTEIETFKSCASNIVIRHYGN